MHLAEVERLRGRYAEAMELTRKGIVVARRLGDEGAFGAFMSVNLADDLFLLGRWDEADAQLSELQSERLASTGEVFRDTLAGQLAVARGDFEAAAASFERAGRDRAGLLSELLASLGAGLAELALWQRRPETARDHVRETLAAIEGAEDRLYAPSVYALGVRALADLSERPERRERSEDTREEARARSWAGWASSWSQPTRVRRPRSPLRSCDSPRRSWRARSPRRHRRPGPSRPRPARTSSTPTPPRTPASAKPKRASWRG